MDICLGKNSEHMVQKTEAKSQTMDILKPAKNCVDRPFDKAPHRVIKKGC